MQYEILFSISIIIILILFEKYLLSFYFRARWNKKRHKKSIRDIYIEFQDKCTFEEFQMIWMNLAKVMKLDAEKIRPDDELDKLAKLYPFSEILFDDVEEILVKESVASQLNSKLTIFNIVNQLIESKQKS